MFDQLPITLDAPPGLETTPIGVLVALFILSVSYVGLNFLFFFLFRLARHLGGGMGTMMDNEFIPALKNPIHYGVILVSLFLSSNYLFPDRSIFGYSIIPAFKMLFILWAAYTINKVVRVSMGWSSESAYGSKPEINNEVLPIISKTVSVLLYSSALLVVLYQFGIEVAPLLAGLGIAGLAVALALQDSLSNFFAGVYVLVDKPIQVGDYVKLEDGNEGYVQEIGWRSIRLRTLYNNVVVIPNNKLSASVITNYSLPNPGIWTSVEVGVSYGSDPEKVERALLRAAKEARKKTDSIINDVEPLVRFSDFADSSLMFKLIVPVDEYTSQWRVSTLLRKEIFQEFKKKGIEIPFPIRTIYTKRAK